MRPNLTNLKLRAEANWLPFSILDKSKISISCGGTGWDLQKLVFSYQIGRGLSIQVGRKILLPEKIHASDFFPKGGYPDCDFHRGTACDTARFRLAFLETRVRDTQVPKIGKGGVAPALVVLKMFTLLEGYLPVRARDRNQPCMRDLAF